MRPEDRATHLIWKLNGKPRKEQLLIESFNGGKEYENVPYKMEGIEKYGEYGESASVLSIAGYLPIINHSLVLFAFSSIFFSSFLAADMNTTLKKLLVVVLLPAAYFIFHSVYTLEETAKSIKCFRISHRMAKLKKEIDAFVDSREFQDIYKDNINAKEIKALIKKWKKEKAKSFFDFRDALVDNLDHKWERKRELTREDVRMCLYQTIASSKWFGTEIKEEAKARLDAWREFKRSLKQEQRTDQA